MLIDIHCHLDHHYFKDDLDKVIENARKAGVVKIITAGIDHKTNKISLFLAKKYDIVETALGFYPQDALEKEGYYKHNPDAEKISINKEIDFIKKNKDMIIAIGECGLDLHTGDIKNINKQISDFRKLIELSIELDRPIIIHSRKAEKQVLETLDEFKGRLDPKKVILHCFSGKKSLIKKAIEKGYTFTIPTNIVRAENFQHLVKECPLKQLLTETDSPYLSPYKNKDKSFNRNEPAYVKESILMIAKIKAMTKEECTKQIFMNYQAIFLK